MDGKRLSRLSYDESGLISVSRIGPDMYTLLASDRRKAKEPMSLLCCRIGREIGSLCAAVSELDAPVFTGGIGENAVPIRETVYAAPEWPASGWIAPPTGCLPPAAKYPRAKSR